MTKGFDPMLTTAIRRRLSLALSVPALLVGCSAGYIVNGDLVTDKETSVHASSWKAADSSVASKTRLQGKERESILNLIAYLEAEGKTGTICTSLVLVDIDRLNGSHLQFASGHTFGPITYPEHWRVLACDKKHSWIVFDERGQATAVFARSPGEDWNKIVIREPSASKSSPPSEQR